MDLEDKTEAECSIYVNLNRKWVKHQAGKSMIHKINSNIKDFSKSMLTWCEVSKVQIRQIEDLYNVWLDGEADRKKYDYRILLTNSNNFS